MTHKIPDNKQPLSMVSAGSSIAPPTLDFELHDNQDGVLFSSVFWASGTWQVLNKQSLSKWLDR